jgi:hypothetical protein
VRLRVWIDKNKKKERNVRPIEDHDWWSFDDWDKTALTILEQEKHLSPNAFAKGRTIIVRNIQHSQALEDGRKSGKRYRTTAHFTLNAMTLLARLEARHIVRLEAV